MTKHVPKRSLTFTSWTNPELKNMCKSKCESSPNRGDNEKSFKPRPGFVIAILDSQRCVMILSHLQCVCVCDLCRKSISPRVGIGQVSLNSHEQSWSLRFTSMWLQTDAALGPSSIDLTWVRQPWFMLQYCCWNKMLRLGCRNLQTKTKQTLTCKMWPPKTSCKSGQIIPKPALRGCWRGIPLTFHHNLRRSPK